MGKLCGALAWERGSKGISPLTVTLQQVELRGKALALALVCEGEGREKNPSQAAGYLCDSMVGWFHDEFLSYAKRETEDGKENLKELLCDRWERCMAEWRDFTAKMGERGEIGVSGLLVWEDAFVAFGNRPIYVLNRRFHRLRLKNLLPVGKEISFLQGSVQGAVKLYLGSEVMGEHVREDEVLESLWAEDSMEEKKLERRLKELVKAGCERSGKKSAGAVLLEVAEC